MATTNPLKEYWRNEQQKVTDRSKLLNDDDKRAKELSKLQNPMPTNRYEDIEYDEAKLFYKSIGEKAFNQFFTVFKRIRQIADKCTLACYEGIKATVYPDWEIDKSGKSQFPELIQKEILSNKEVYEPDENYTFTNFNIVDYVRKRANNSDGWFMYILGPASSSHMITLVYEKFENDETFYLADQSTGFAIADGHCIYTGITINGYDISGLASYSNTEIQNQISNIVKAVRNHFIKEFKQDNGKKLFVWQVNPNTRYNL